MDPQIKDKLEEAEFFFGERENSFQDNKKFKFYIFCLPECRSKHAMLFSNPLGVRPR
jgi:hypothetical protein